jgi:hypothetical protein
VRIVHMGCVMQPVSRHTLSSHVLLQEPPHPWSSLGSALLIPSECGKTSGREKIVGALEPEVETAAKADYRPPSRPVHSMQNALDRAGAHMASGWDVSGRHAGCPKIIAEKLRQIRARITEGILAGEEDVRGTASGDRAMPALVQSHSPPLQFTARQSGKYTLGLHMKYGLPIQLGVP